MDDWPAIDPRHRPLSRAERWVLGGFFVVLLLFGGLVEFRTAFLQHRKGDLNVFLRAAWAVRTGADPYAVTDDNGFHYHYPPLLAILASPLADPPPGWDSRGMVPFALSVGLCYILNLLCLAFAVHQLAGALERTATGPLPLSGSPGSRGWWALRVCPVVACLIPIGHTLMRGQVNLLLLALFAGYLAALLRGQRFLSGLWLAGTICLKIIPAFLLLMPLWRRDGRCLLGCAAGLLLGLVALPVLYLGPARTVECYRDMTRAVLLPGLGGEVDPSRAEELTNQTATEGQSILTALHNTLHPDSSQRPHRASVTVRLVSYLLGGLLTLATLGAGGWRPHSAGVDVVLFFGVLVLDMLLVSPVCHLHYFSLELPLVMALLAQHWQRREGLSPGIWLAAILGINVLALLLPNLPEMFLCRDCGCAMYGSLLLWLTAIVLLSRRTNHRVTENTERKAQNNHRALAWKVRYGTERIRLLS
jgi:hypothetical protein